VRARDNPFGARRIERLPFRFPAGDDWPALLSRLEAHAWRGAIVGPHGTGKTTVLEQLLPHLTARGFRPHLLTLRAESTAADKQTLLTAAALHAPDFLLLDGAEQLSPRQWQSLEHSTRTAAGCVITMHHTARLPTVLETTSSPTLLDDLTHELSAAPLHPGESNRLFQRHAGNLRDCLRELYDRWASE
jgi:hypothetical protein